MKWLFILLIVVSLVWGQDIIGKDSITLLALTENGSAQTGTAATLELELRQGKDRVYLETYPMTKITTQASLRFAQQVACKELDIDCSRYDFMFSIKALPGIVGGPSAGAAATLLTSAVLLNRTVPKDMAMTGTINSGGIIGPVGGVDYKIEAASASGIKTVFVPKGTKNSSDGNGTISISKFGEARNVSVKEVATIQEVYAQVLGIPQGVENASLEINPQYEEIMKEVSDELCQRTGEIKVKKDVSIAANLSKRAAQAKKNKEYYAAASYCFRSNVELKREWYVEQNFSVAEIDKRANEVSAQSDAFASKIEREQVKTLTDLQTVMAVLERVSEAQKLARQVEDDASKNITDAAEVGYAEERLFSAKTWARFFNSGDGNLSIDPKKMEEGCGAKIAEAEERYNYVKSVLPDALDGTRKDIDLAYQLLQEKKYPMCLYTAAKAKAEADVVMGVLGVEDSRIDEIISLKLQVAKEALRKEQEKNIFPIIAYSNYEYANSLKDFDKVSALLFSEYALELANLDIYFVPTSKQKEVVVDVEKPVSPYAFGIVGALAGAMFMALIWKGSISRREKTLQAPPKRRLRGKKR